ncbi:hypothetical protein CQO09_16225 [Salmonella enterica subsp. enterica serovar Typhimurium]|nr:hypothetical protein [Salmonella enterica subsp. enterica serovar Typhimurium]
MPKLNKREREYLRPAIVFGYEIEVRPYRAVQRWDGDDLLPVRVGKMAESLVERGYLEEVGKSDRHWWSIRATEKAKRLKCRADRCSNGRLYNDDDEEIGDCPVCGGTGINHEKDL